MPAVRKSKWRPNTRKKLSMLIKMTSQTAFLILGAVFTLQMMSGCEARRFDKTNWKTQDAGSVKEMKDHDVEPPVDDGVVALEDKPYCCRKYTTFPKTPDAEGFPASLVTHVNSLVSGYFTSSNSTVHLSPSVGFCGDVVTIVEPNVHCVPLCCTCCADIAIRRDDLVLPGSDLHLCCPEATDGECYVLDGSTGKVGGEVDATHPGVAALDALLAAIDDYEQLINEVEFCGCLNLVGQLDYGSDSLHDAAEAAIAELDQCDAASQFLAIDPDLLVACLDYTSPVGTTCDGFLGHYKTSVTAARDCFRSEPVTVYCAPRSECGFNHN
eukprot:215902_1